MARGENEAMDVSTASVGVDSDKVDYQELCEHVNEIAQPLASKKLAKKITKLVKKAAEAKGMKQGVADVHREIRKFKDDEKAIIILAGNVYPIDVYSHVPALCEEKGLPYAFVPSKEMLGKACGHKRNAVLVFIKKNESYEELFDEVSEAIGNLTIDVATS
uniref:H/ACA ribonucleoprotein complex subunit 2 n=1 Tax=Steinernema glaseri TaxID=37863 RepID=A0A1I7YBV5_9BILA